MPLRQLLFCTPLLLVFSAFAVAQGEEQLTDERQILEMKLDQKMDFEFRKTAFQDVVAELSKRAEIPISIDGESLKAEGLTRNMSQTFALKNASVREALLALLNGKGHQIIADHPRTLIVVYDEKTHGLIVSTHRRAEKEKLKEYQLKSLTLEEKLQQKIEIDFRKTALQDAFAYISGESRIPIVLDGEALKSVGFTQNMNQDMNLGEVTVQEALLAIMKGKGHKIIEDNPDTMILIIDEQSQGFTVSAVPYATERGFKPYEFK